MPKQLARLRDVVVPIVLFLVIFTIYFGFKETTYLADPVWTLNTSLSILHTGQPYVVRASAPGRVYQAG